MLSGKAEARLEVELSVGGARPSWRGLESARMALWVKFSKDKSQALTSTAEVFHIPIWSWKETSEGKTLAMGIEM